MAEENVTIVLSLEDGATIELAELLKLFDALGDEADDAGDDVEKAGEQISKMSRASNAGSAALGKLAKGAGIVAAGVGSAIAGLGALAVIGDKLVDAWSDQASVVNAAGEAYRRAGVESDKVQGKLEGLNVIAGELAGQTLFGDEQIFAAAERYITLSGDAEVVTRDLDVILGIAQGTQRDAAGAAELYAKALKGDIGPLKDLTALTTEQEAELNKLRGTQEQTAFVTELLASQYGGLAQQVDPTTLALNNAQAAFGDVQQAMGGVISQSGAIGPVVNAVTDVFRFLEGAIYDNSEAIQQWILDAVIAGVDGVLVLTRTLVENVDWLGATATTAVLAGKALSILVDTVQLVAQAMRVVLTTALAGVSEAFATLIEGAAELAALVGDTGLERKFRNTAASARDFGTSMAGEALEGAEAVKQEALEMTATFDEFGGELDKMPDRAKAARDVLVGLGRGAADLKDQLVDAKGEVRALTSSTTTTGGGPSVPTVNTDVVDRDSDKDAAAAKDAKNRALREEIAAKELLAAQAREFNPILAAELEFEAALIAIKAQDLTESERKLALLEAEAGLRDELNAIREEQAASELEMIERQTAALDEYIAKWSAAADAISSISTGVGEVDAVASALGDVGNAGLNAFETFEKSAAESEAAIAKFGEGSAEALEAQRKGAEASAEASINAAGVAGQAINGIAAAAGLGAREQAVILAVFEAAQAAASYATGLIPKGVQHTVAAGLYAAAAGTSAPSVGSSVSASAPSSGGLGGLGSGAFTADPRELYELQAEIIAGAIDPSSGGGGITLILDQRDSINGQITPEMERKIARGAQAGLQQQGISLDASRRRRIVRR